MKRFTLVVATLSLSFAGPAAAQDAPRKFVQGFLDWYVPLATSETREPASTAALRKKGRDFAPALRRELEEDAAAQAKAAGDLVGLDFDPFLNSQDPCERYEAKNVTAKDGAFEVEIYAVCSGMAERQPSAVAVIVKAGSRWQFANFRYPETKGNLREILKGLRQERRK